MILCEGWVLTGEEGGVCWGCVGGGLVLSGVSSAEEGAACVCVWGLLVLG